MRTLGIAVCVGLCVAGMTQVSFAQPRSPSPLSQPFRDIGLIRDQIPPVLVRASDNPYAPPRMLANDDVDCTAVAHELGELDDALGPDVDMPQQRRSRVGGWVAGAVRDAVSLPYRGVVRSITGAERRDRQMRDAVQAGNLRRAFLKGFRDTSCRRLRNNDTGLAPAPQLTASMRLDSLEREVTTVSSPSQTPSSVPMQTAAAPGAGR